ncbi:hypothetical protein WDU94_013844 [Cyamophila willieti]
MDSMYQKIVFVGAASGIIYMFGRHLFNAAFYDDSSNIDEVTSLEENIIEPDNSTDGTMSDRESIDGNIVVDDNTIIGQNINLAEDIGTRSLPIENVSKEGQDGPTASELKESSSKNVLTLPTNSLMMQQLLRSGELQDIDSLDCVEPDPMLDRSLQRFEDRILGHGSNGSWFQSMGEADSQLFLVILLNKNINQYSPDLHNFVRYVNCMWQKKMKESNPSLLNQWKAGGVQSKVLTVDGLSMLQSFNEKALANDVPKAFPYVQHTCYVRERLCSTVVPNCGEYTRILNCCCHQYLGAKWKQKTSDAFRFKSEISLVLLPMISSLTFRHHIVWSSSS